MKKIILFLLLLGFLGNLQAQVGCEPDESVPDTVVLSPLPYDPVESPEGGITDTACVNSPFDFTFTVNVPETFNFGGFEVPLDSVVFAPADDEMPGITLDPPLPGFTYVCDPPDCVYPGGEKGCLKIYGETTNEADIGDHFAEFSGRVWINFGGNPQPVAVTFPDENNPIVPPGEYNLVVQPEDFGNCDVAVGTTDELPGIFRIHNQPNPFSDLTQIEVESEVSATYEFRVHDLFGRLLHREQVRILAGLNTIPFDGSRLSSGMYVYSLSDGKAAVSRRMIISRR